MKFLTSLLVVSFLAAGAVAAETTPMPAELSLDTVLSLALEHNYTIRQARAQHAEASGAVMTSEAGRLPSISANGTYTRIADSLVERQGGFSFGSNTSWNTRLEATQVLYSGGAVRSSIAASRALRDASVSGFEETVQSVLLSVRVNYFDVLLAREQIVVEEQAIKLLEEELANARARVKAGSGSPFDELRAEVAVANGKPALIRARDAYRIAAVDLLLAIGLPAEEGTADKVTGELAAVPHEVSLESALASANEKRPEIRRLEKLVVAAESSVEIARSGAKPVVSVAGGYGVQKAQLGTSNSDSVEGWNVGVQASWDIFDGNATRGRVAQARARLDQARLNLQETTLSIEADVRRSYASFLDAQELVTASQRVIDQAEEALRLARSRFSAGAATQLDVLTAQTALTDARSNAAQALHDVSVAYAYLDRSAVFSDLPTGTPPLDQ